MDDQHRAETREALAQLGEHDRQAYISIADGLATLESTLPETCADDEAREVIGLVIGQAKAAEKFSVATFQALTAPWSERIATQRGLWQPLAARAKAIVVKAQALVETLLAEQALARRDAEARARAAVVAAQKEQADAEALALAAGTPEAQAIAANVADAAWIASRDAVRAMDKAPAQTAIKVGGATVYESSRLDFEVTDIAAFAAAHPELIEIKRGPTLTGLRASLRGMPALPETLAGWPGLKLRIAKKTASRA